jgi:hypothetical protein
MDIGMIVIQVANGTPIVVRCEAGDDGTRPVPAVNAQELVEQAAGCLQAQGVMLDVDGFYLCSDELQSAAHFEPLPLPDDARPYHTARSFLYPDVSPNDAWKLLHEDRKAGRLTVYRIGVGINTRQYVSEAELVRLMEHRKS